MWPKSPISKFAPRILLLTLGVIFVIETAIMIAFAILPIERHNRWLDVIVDSSMLTLGTAPLLYWLIVRPVRVLAEERSQLLAHVLEVQEAERRRIARDLHDEIGQSFTSMLLQLRQLEDAPTLEIATSKARELRELSRAVYEEIRSLARGLYPSVLEDLGLEQAVRRLAEDFESLHGTNINVEVTGSSKERLDRRLESTAYRVIQESLTNCAKYAQARHIDIRIAFTTIELVVTIADDGKGFDVATLMQSPRRKTFGLISMRERALLHHGSLIVRSHAGDGTTVTLRVPIKDFSHDQDPRIDSR